VDYIQPKSADFPEKMCCTVTINNVSVYYYSAVFIDLLRVRHVSDLVCDNYY